MEKSCVTTSTPNLMQHVTEQTYIFSYYLK